jgi:hypothetical protein
MTIAARRRRTIRGVWWIGAVFLVACTGSDIEGRAQAGAAGDTSGGASERAATAKRTTIAADTPRTPPTRPPPPRRVSPPRDADHHFLRDLVDHHEGMILLAHAAMEREHGRHGGGDDPALAADSYRDAEKQRIRAVLDSVYGDAFEPAVPPRVRAETDSILRLEGEEFERGFEGFTRRYHRETIAMIDRALPGLRRAPVIMLARQIRDRHAKELSVLERPTGSG